MRRCWLRTIVAILLLSPAAAAGAERAPLPTDANLVTALDVSDSIMRHEVWLEFEGLARAVTHPDFLAAVASGTYGRIGFAVLAWSSGSRAAPLVPWTIIETVDDARRVASALTKAPRIGRSGWARRDNGSDLSTAGERRTDISAALDLAQGLLLSAPYRAPRGVINLCANGADNVGLGPRAARSRALAAGIVINALVMGPRAPQVAYFDREVRGGPGSFVMQVSAPEDVAAAMRAKLLRDLIATRPQALLPAPVT